MSFFRSLSIRKKILLIPLVGLFGFGLYLFISISASMEAVENLEYAQKVEFPVLQVSERSIFRLEKIKETLSYAASSGDADVLNSSKALAQEMTQALDKAAVLSSNDRSQLNEIKQAFNTYFSDAFNLSEAMVSGSIDFSTLGGRSQNMASKLANTENLLSAVKDKKNEDFSNAFNPVSYTHLTLPTTPYV